MLAIIIESCPSMAIPIRGHVDAPGWWIDTIARQDHARVQYFLDHHYDVNESFDGVLPIEKAARAHDPVLVDLLLQHGASVTAIPDGGHSILASAVLATRTNV